MAWSAAALGQFSGLNFSMAFDGFHDASRRTAFAHCAVGDLDGDGVADLLVNLSRGYSPSAWSWLRGVGDGTFGPPTIIDQYWSAGVAAAIADFDGDGIADVVYPADVLEIFNPIGRALGVRRGRGGGDLAPVSYTPFPGYHPNQLLAFDLDGDGRLDLVFQAGQQSQFGGGRTEILLGDGSLHFERSQGFDGPGPGHYASLGDVDGDGDVDIVTAGAVQDGANGSSVPCVQVFRNDGVAGFGPLPRIVLADLDPSDTDRGAPTSAAVADFDGDGDLDIAVVVIEGTPTGPGASSVRILLNDGRGAFSEAAVFRSQRIAWRLAAADLNGDGHPDLVHSSAGGIGGDGGVEVFRNLGDGVHFAGGSLVISSGFAVSTVVADLDGHGGPDLVSADTAGRIQVALNFTPQDGSVVPDLDNDMSVGARDVELELAMWRAQYPLGDIDADGMVTSRDLGLMLGSYGMSVDAPSWYQPGGTRAATAGPSEHEARAFSEQLMRDADADGDGHLTSLELARALGAIAAER